jgi:hypothetical protein
MALILLFSKEYAQLAYAVGALLTIPAKQMLDTPRRRAISVAK